MGLISKALVGLGRGMQEKAGLDWEQLKESSRQELQAELQRVARQYQVDDHIRDRGEKLDDYKTARDDHTADVADQRTYENTVRKDTQGFTADENAKTRGAAAAERAANRKDMVDVLDANGDVIGQRDKNTNTYVPIRETKQQDRYEDILDPEGNVIGQRETRSNKKTPFTVPGEFGGQARAVLPGAAPAMPAGQGAPAPPKEYPNAQWDAARGVYIVMQNGKPYVVR